jgi:hypothetical protein
MDEQGWLTSTDPAAMLAGLTGRTAEPCPAVPSNRKLQLFAAACCRRLSQHWPERMTKREAELLAALDVWADSESCPHLQPQPAHRRLTAALLRFVQEFGEDFPWGGWLPEVAESVLGMPPASTSSRSIAARRSSTRRPCSAK